MSEIMDELNANNTTAGRLSAALGLCDKYAARIAALWAALEPFAKQAASLPEGWDDNTLIGGGYTTASVYRSAADLLGLPRSIEDARARGAK